jgi:hypothetical protein
VPSQISEFIGTLGFKNLANAQLKGASFENMNLSGSDLREANLTGASHNDKTRWPEGFDPTPAPASPLTYLERFKNWMGISS